VIFTVLASAKGELPIEKFAVLFPEEMVTPSGIETAFDEAESVIETCPLAGALESVTVPVALFPPTTAVGETESLEIV